MTRILAKLDQNESPIPPPLDLLSEAYRISIKEINRYQRRELYEIVRELYAEYVGISKDFIWIQPGVDLFFEDILVTRDRRRIIVPYPSYFLFIEQAKHYGYNIVKLPLDNNFANKIFTTAREKKNIVYIDNPNNPTGRIIIRKQEIHPLLNTNNNLVLIDEAYYEFCNYTLKDLVRNHDNIVVFRTMSKAFGFAGGRVAFCISNPHLAENIFYYDIIRFRISTISLMTAKILLENRYYVNRIINTITRERSRVIHTVRKMGLHVYDSCTNFIMIDTGIPRIADLLRREGVLVKDLGKIFGNDFVGYIRVTIGLPKENNAFLDSLEKIISKYSTKYST